jgi:hypothetical protein
MTDVIGQRIISLDGTSMEGVNMIELDLSAVAKGVYLITLTNDERSQQLNLVVE